MYPPAVEIHPLTLLDHQFENGLQFGLTACGFHLDCISRPRNIRQVQFGLRAEVIEVEDFDFAAKHVPNFDLHSRFNRHIAE